jgi:hypothetical protein
MPSMSGVKIPELLFSPAYSKKLETDWGLFTVYIPPLIVNIPPEGISKVLRAELIFF